MHEVLVNRLGGLSLPRKSVVRLTDRPDMTLDVYRGRKTTIQYGCISKFYKSCTEGNGITAKKKPKVPLQNRQHKSRVKKYWSTELQVSWDKVSVAEKRWLKFKGSTASRNKLRAEYCSLRHEFDKMNRRAKRAYQSHEQQNLYDKLYNTENPREFWTQIGKIGISNDRKTSIPFEVIADDNTVKTDYSSVMGK